MRPEAPSMVASEHFFQRKPTPSNFIDSKQGRHLATQDMMTNPVETSQRDDRRLLGDGNKRESDAQ